MFLIDKYRPNLKENSQFNNDIIDMIEIMSKDEAIPHLILYGPDGSGKRTIINIFLEMLFGENVNKTKDISYEIVSSGGKKTIEKIKQSNYHIEINPKGTNYDRYLIHDIVKEYARCNSLNTIFENNKQFKVVLINNVDNLSPGAQLALRRTMEVYSDKCRFIMWCKSLSKIIKELQSRCIKQRVPAPNDKDICKYISNIAIEEKIQLDSKNQNKIVKFANGNVKLALWQLEFIKHDTELNKEYFNSLNKILELLLNKQYETKEIRELFFNLMITNYTGQNILKDLVNIIFDSPLITDNVKQKIIAKSAEIEYRLMKGRRDIIHLEAFTMYAIEMISLQ